MAGGSPGLCSERSRAKTINGGKGEGHLPGGLRLMLSSPATAPGFDGMLLTRARVSPVPLCSLLDKWPWGYCQTPALLHSALSAWTGQGKQQPVAFGTLSLPVTGWLLRAGRSWPGVL